ncbi:MAG: SCO family protein [Paludibacterium sp.]|uniref:SCO family protein n=1 Tax=Paludibacterium sp. TaxID=1917523 RepID=UPI0025DB78C3|nr:SCO family protein [Paludibacterium sp.]MBV8045798.1 SCO family protein [Paludibacterium sp.]MBV8647069.1 SCO family protein [Paludibacterium sp.]
MRFFRRMLLLALVVALAACQRVEPIKLDLKGTDLTGTEVGGDFTLTDHTGKPRALSSFRGKVVALFFGYTHCPDVCPTTLLEYANIYKKLGADGGKLQVVFVSVDPERDTQQVLAGYVPHFNPTFVGLTGSVAQVASVMKAYKVVAQKVPAAGGDYSVDHSAGSYLLDAEGRVRVYEPYGSPAADVVHDIQQLLR